MKNLLLIIVFSAGVFVSIHAQTPVLVVSSISINRQYCYDEAGNRICRYPVKLTKTPIADDEHPTAAKSEVNEDNNVPIDYCVYEEDVKIYPIPNNGQFTIELAQLIENLTAEIYDFNGKQIYSTKLLNLKTEISGVFISPGNYILTLTCSNVKLDWTITVIVDN